jgi:CRP-like cAMP-binding protein
MPDADLLGQVWLFRRASKESLEKLATFAFNKVYQAGEVIVEEGNAGNGIYMITSGKVEVIKDLASGSPRRIGVLDKGELFGEMALMDEQPRSATVRAIEETSCLGIDRSVFLAQILKDPNVAITMIQALAQRLREADKNFSE